MDEDLITLVQQELQRLIKDHANIKSKLSAFELRRRTEVAEKRDRKNAGKTYMLGWNVDST